MSVLTQMSPRAPRLSVKCIGSVTLYRSGRERPTKRHKERERWGGWGESLGGVLALIECTTERAMRQECQYILRVSPGIPKHGAKSRHSRTASALRWCACVRACVHVRRAAATSPSCVYISDGASQSRTERSKTLLVSRKVKPQFPCHPKCNR